MALTDQLVSYWKLDETSGNRADAHASNTLTDNNTVGSATGKINNGADFELTNAESLSLTLGSTGLEIKDNFTVSFWYNPESLTTYHQFYTSGTQANHWRIGLASGTYRLRFTIDGIADYTAAANGLSTATWYHIVVTKSGNDVVIYRNASSVHTATVSASVTTPSGTAYMGRLAGADGYADGIIDEFGIWSRALSGTEVTELYNAGAGLAYPFTSTANTGNFFTFF